MPHVDIEVFLGRKMPDTGEEGLPQRPIIRPLRKDFVDGRVVDGRFPSEVGWHRPALPLHPGVEPPHDEVKDAGIAQLALRSSLGHREVWQDTCLELWGGALDRNRCRGTLWCRSAPHVMASLEEW